VAGDGYLATFARFLTNNRRLISRLVLTTVIGFLLYKLKKMPTSQRLALYRNACLTIGI
jgi:hypothetical protein